MLKNEKILYALVVTISFLLVGTAGYEIIEGYPALDALYMTVITISTVGFGEIQTLSEAGRIFTMFLIIFGLGSIAFLAHSFTEALIERASSQNIGRKNMLKKVRQLSGHHIICGFGRVGESAAERLHTLGEDFVVIESGEEQIRAIQSLGYNYIEGDATREEMLLNAGIKKAQSLLSLLDEDPDNLFVVLTARELNPTLHIIARTEVVSSETRMLRAGADSIFSIYASAGRRVADKIIEQEKPANDNAVIPAEAGGDVQTWVKVTPASELEGHVVETANSLLGGVIIGIRRNGTDMLLPGPEEQLSLDDQLLVGRANGKKENAQGTNGGRSGKIVLIDDNPVIRRLYTRLFQKAGFHILTAEAGWAGFNLILKEMPDAAVIDYHLPDMNGLDVSRMIREVPELKNVKLFMFTGDDEARTRKEALKTGVDTVVFKSPDATEIINAVQRGLEEIGP